MLLKRSGSISSLFGCYIRPRKFNISCTTSKKAGNHLRSKLEYMTTRTVMWISRFFINYERINVHTQVIAVSHDCDKRYASVQYIHANALEFFVFKFLSHILQPITKAYHISITPRITQKAIVVDDGQTENSICYINKKFIFFSIPLMNIIEMSQSKWQIQLTSSFVTAKCSIFFVFLCQTETERIACLSYVPIGIL